MKITLTLLSSVTSTKAVRFWFTETQGQKFSSEGQTHKSIFPQKRFFVRVWVLLKNVSRILATIDFSTGKIARKLCQ